MHTPVYEGSLKEVILEFSLSSRNASDSALQDAIEALILDLS